MHWKCRSELQEKPEKAVSHFFGTRQLSWIPDFVLDANRPVSPDLRTRRLWTKSIENESTEDLESLQDDGFVLSEVASCATTVAEANNMEDSLSINLKGFYDHPSQDLESPAALRRRSSVSLPAPTDYLQTESHSQFLAIPQTHTHDEGHCFGRENRPAAQPYSSAGREPGANPAPAAIPRPRRQPSRPVEAQAAIRRILARPPPPPPLHQPPPHWEDEIAAAGSPERSVPYREDGPKPRGDVHDLTAMAWECCRALRCAIAVAVMAWAAGAGVRL